MGKNTKRPAITRIPVLLRSWWHTIAIGKYEMLRIVINQLKKRHFRRVINGFLKQKHDKQATKKSTMTNARRKSKTETSFLKSISSYNSGRLQNSTICLKSSRNTSAFAGNAIQNSVRLVINCIERSSTTSSSTNDFLIQNWLIIIMRQIAKITFLHELLILLKISSLAQAGNWL